VLITAKPSADSGVDPFDDFGRFRIHP